LNRDDPGLVFALFRPQMILTLLMPAAGCQLKVVSRPQIMLESKAQADEKAQSAIHSGG
jgi:hypothetical protein